MKVLNSVEMDGVSGAGNYADKHGPGASNSSGGGKSPGSGNGNYTQPGVGSCNNGIIGGMVAGSAGGLVGISLGLAGGAIAGGCFDKGNSNVSGPSSACNGSNNSSAGGIGGQCSW